MPSYTQGGAARTPFGKRQPLRSTKDYKTNSFTVAASGVPSVVIDTYTEKPLQPGTVMASITSGADTGKIGAYEANVQGESVSIPVDATGGTFTITFAGTATAAIAFNATAAAVQAALELNPNINVGDIAVTGGPGNAGGTTPYVITFLADGQYGNVDAPTITTGAGSLTGGAGTATPATTAGGTTGTGATDGRGDPANIVGICMTFLPWQLLEHDDEVSVWYAADLYQARCSEYDASGVNVPLTDATKAILQANPDFQFTFHTASTEL